MQIRFKGNNQSHDSLTQDLVLSKIRKDEATKFLSDLVKIPSVTGSEGDASRFVQSWCEKNGLESELQLVTGDRYNVIVKLKGMNGKSKIHFNGHIDTYPMTEEWSKSLLGKITNSRVYGIGSVDDKGGTVAMLIAAKALQESKVEFEGDIFLTAVPGHLEGGSGVRRLLASRFKADAGVVCEPTNMKVITCHMASLYFQITAKGIPALDTHKENGVNSILHMMKIIQELEKLERSYQRTWKHPILGVPLVNIGKIEGGLRHNIVPDVCKLSFSIRYLPGQTPRGIKKEIEIILKDLKNRKIGGEPSLNATVSYLKGWYDWPRLPLELSRDCYVVRSLETAYQKVTGEQANVTGEKYWTDASIFSRAGIPSVVFGPGNDACYWVNEYMETAQLIDAAKIYCLLMLDLTSKDSEQLRKGSSLKTGGKEESLEKTLAY
jgi:acetylornithine deacetylase/succinyl-diaminopimelate desuccinylase family protein